MNLSSVVAGSVVALTVAAAAGLHANQDQSPIAWIKANAIPLTTVEAGHGFADMQTEVEAATKKATLVPMVVAERAKETRQIIESLRPITNPKMASDLTVGVAMANAAITGALANVEINLGDLKDETFLADVKQRVSAVRA